ncbi:MAG: biotin/lipoyl-binding protein, partial [Planctomycetes bacterium]|nr:biotin/lipoyl-binding protein [Planctomycetota bacterium]
MTEDDPIFALEEPDPTWVSVSGLQCQLRELFATRPPYRAVAAALEAIGSLLEADYAVIHACVGARPLSEEWSRAGYGLRDTLREHVNTAMMTVIEADEPRCIRIGGADGEADTTVTAAVLYDAKAEAVGSIGIALPDTGRAHAYEVLVQLESIAGFLALLLSQDGTAPAAAPALDTEEAGHPLRLLLRLISELTAQHDLDQAAIGLVDGRKARVTLMNNEVEPRRSNPGVRAIEAAMCECLDLEQPVRITGSEREPAYRLHGAWRQERAGGTVASVPLIVEGRTIAILSLATSHETGLPDSTLRKVQKDFTGYAALLPLTRLATRSLARHAWDSVHKLWQRLGHRRRRTMLTVGAAIAACAWLMFGTLTYRITVPCVVAAMEPRVISCPRDGILAELFVRPGDLVHEGQLLAELDSHDDQLRKAELAAELLTIDAQIDVALGDHDSGKLRVLEAQRQGIESQLAVVARRIEHARIRSPIEGVILAGELREQVGARIA